MWKYHIRSAAGYSELTDSFARRDSRPQRSADNADSEQTDLTLNKQTENTPIVVFESVSKSFSEGALRRPVLSNLNATFARGGFHAVIGRSGSGKSTLLNLIAGIDLPDKGNIRINDFAINKISENERTLFRRKKIGFIFQFFNLIPSLTVHENVRLPLELVGMDSQHERVTDILERVGLNGRKNDYPEVLSGGEQQRVAIARAVVHEPDLLLADEPTGNLDDATADRILDVLCDAARQRTVVLVTHSRRISHQADEVWPLRYGTFDQSEKAS